MTPTPLVLVVIAGPQASGKSTLATALSAELRSRGERVALVELDQIAEMALPTLPSWDAAHHIFESTVGLWARTDLTCVVAEGSGSHSEVVRLLAQIPVGGAHVTISITASFEPAYARAQADPTRGILREFEFLNEVYRQWPGELAQIDSDAVIDTSMATVEQSLKLIMDAISSARLALPAPASTPPVDVLRSEPTV